MKGKEKTKRTRKVTVRFTETEFNKIDISFRRTTKQKLSEYVRFLLLEKPVTVYTRDKSIDEILSIFTSLKSELSAIGNNFNQVVKRLHTASHFQEIKALATQAEIQREKFSEKVGEINHQIAQLSDKWLQE